MENKEFTIAFRFLDTIKISAETADDALKKFEASLSMKDRNRLIDYQVLDEDFQADASVPQ